MSEKYTRITDVAKFLAEKGKKRIGNHSFSRMILNYPYCSHCGLVTLKNETTRKAMKEKCISYEDDD